MQTFEIEKVVNIFLNIMLCGVVPSDDVLQVFATYSGCLLLDGRALCFPDTGQTASEKSKYHINYMPS